MAFIDKEFQLKVYRINNVLHRLCGRNGFCILLSGSLAARLLWVKRDFGSDIFEGLGILGQRRHFRTIQNATTERGLARRPSGYRVPPNSESQGCSRFVHHVPKRYKRCVLCPACAPMSKAPSLPFPPDIPEPCGPSRCAWCGIRFIPTLKALKPFHDRMILLRQTVGKSRYYGF